MSYCYKWHVANEGAYSLLEDWRIRVRNSVANFLLGSIRAYNAVLTLSGSL